MNKWPSDQLEALHTCHIIEDMFERHIIDAVFVEERPDILAKANDAHVAIGELYQAIGRLSTKK